MWPPFSSDASAEGDVLENKTYVSSTRTRCFDPIPKDEQPNNTEQRFQSGSEFASTDFHQDIWSTSASIPQSTPPKTPKPASIHRFPLSDDGGYPETSYLLQLQDSLPTLEELMQKPPNRPLSSLPRQRSERRESGHLLIRTPSRSSRNFESEERQADSTDARFGTMRLDDGYQTFRSSPSLTVRQISDVDLPKRREPRGRSRLRTKSTRRRSVDETEDDATPTPRPHIEQILGVPFEFPDYEHLATLPQRNLDYTQDGTADMRGRRPSMAPSKEQQIHYAGLKWAQGYDARDDVRFETFEGGLSGIPIRVRRREIGGYPIPRRGSVPLHFEVFDGRVGGLLVRNRTVRSFHRQPKRSLSQPPRDVSQPIFSFDGTYDDEDLFEDLPGTSFDAEEIASFDGMNPFASFLDQGASTSANNSINNVPRPSPPSAAPQQQQPQQHQVNGAGGPGHVTGLSNGVPHAGHQTDINYLWGIVQELSDILTQNRNQTASIVRSVHQVQERAQEDGIEPTLEQVNGELNANRAAEIADLHGRLNTASRQHDELISENDDLQRLVNDYEGTLQGLMDKLRSYAYDHTNAVIATHRHYNGLLEKEREANLAMRIEHGQWQAGLGRAAELARQALKARSEELMPVERKCKELKAENRVMRRLLGWQVEEDSDDEEERKEEEMQRNAQMQEQGNMNGAASAVNAGAGG